MRQFRKIHGGRRPRQPLRVHPPRPADLRPRHRHILRAAHRCLRQRPPGVSSDHSAAQCRRILGGGRLHQAILAQRPRATPHPPAGARHAGYAVCHGGCRRQHLDVEKRAGPLPREPRRPRRTLLRHREPALGIVHDHRQGRAAICRHHRRHTPALRQRQRPIRHPHPGHLQRDQMALCRQQRRHRAGLRRRGNHRLHPGLGHTKAPELRRRRP